MSALTDQVERITASRCPQILIDLFDGDRLKELCPVELYFPQPGGIFDIQSIHDLNDSRFFDKSNRRFEFAVDSDGYSLFVDLNTDDLFVLRKIGDEIFNLGIVAECLLYAVRQKKYGSPGRSNNVVSLPCYRKPKFPESCVVCDADIPHGTVTIPTQTVLWTTLLGLGFGKRKTVTAPACKGCAIKLHVHRWGSTIVFWLMALIVLPYTSEQLQPWIPQWLMWPVLLLTLSICLLPYGLLEAMFPTPFDVRAYEDETEYEFRDKSYAHRFALENKVVMTGDLSASHASTRTGSNPDAVLNS